MRTDLPDLSAVLWIPIEDIFNGWLSVDSCRIRLGAQEKTYAEWMLLIGDKRTHCQYEAVLPLLTETGFLLPLAFRKEDGNKILPNGHHRLTAAYDLGYKYIPFVYARDDQTTHYEVRDFKYEDLFSLIHPENPLPKNPKSPTIN